MKSLPEESENSQRASILGRNQKQGPMHSLDPHTMALSLCRQSSIVRGICGHRFLAHPRTRAQSGSRRCGRVYPFDVIREPVLCDKEGELEDIER